MPSFRIIGVLLALGLIAWLVWALLWPIGEHPSPEVLGLGNAFQGNLQLPAETISRAFSESRQQMLEVNDYGSHFREAGGIAGWFSFAATAAITLLLGFFGRNLPAAGAAPNTVGLPLTSVRLIGLLAAIAAVLTAFSNLAISKSQDYFKCADEIHDIIMHDRKAVIDASTSDSAQAVLDDLELKTKRCATH